MTRSQTFLHYTFKMRTLTIFSILLTVPAVTYAASKPCFPCDPTWPRPIYYPNYDDCSSLYECNKGNITATACDPGKEFEFMLQSCVPVSPDMLFTCRKLLHKNCA